LKPVEFYKEFPIEMQVVARYHDLGIFLDRVSKYSRIINVDNLRINSAKERDRTIRASFTATTFVYDDETAAAEEEVQ
jgi:type IV pilus assembly protein PilO